MRDAGFYECQVSTEPKLSHQFYLKVVEPKVWIVGNGDVHANQGSKVVLKCRISGTLQMPAYVFWYHNEKRLIPDYADNLSAVVVRRRGTPSQPEKTSSSSANTTAVGDDDLSGGFYEARLVLVDASPEQSGNYTCGPSNTMHASVTLHITQGEIRAAMSDGASGSEGGAIVVANTGIRSGELVNSPVIFLSLLNGVLLFNILT